jgi:hypothetical protein
MVLNFNFTSSLGKPVRGGYEVIVTPLPRGRQPRIGATAGPGPYGHDNSVDVPVPADWRNIQVVVSIRDVDLIGEGDFEEIRRLLDRAAGAFFRGTSRTPFGLWTSLDTTTIYADQAHTQLFDVVFMSTEHSITVATSVELQAAIEAQIQAGALIAGVELGGSISGGVSTTVGTEIRFHTLTGTLEVTRHNS